MDGVPNERFKERKKLLKGKSPHPLVSLLSSYFNACFNAKSEARSKTFRFSMSKIGADSMALQRLCDMMGKIPNSQQCRQRNS